MCASRSCQFVGARPSAFAARHSAASARRRSGRFSGMEFGHLSSNVPVKPRAAAHTSPGQSPGKAPGICASKCIAKRQRRDSSARRHEPSPHLPTRWSIPHVTFIEFDVVLVQELTILLLEGFCPMTLLLRVDVMMRQAVGLQSESVAFSQGVVLGWYE